MRIVSATPAEQFTILIDWSDGSRRLFDVWAHAGDLIDVLSSDARYAKQARIGPTRSGVTWPNGERFDVAEVFFKSVEL